MTNNNDTFISDEEEELCPLCVEEMDISDKNFKPCPCGYQVCQFCYNNIRQNPELNGRCPACRRPYDDESVEYKLVSHEEWKYEQSKQSRKDRERKQKEKEKKENEQANRKHLAGMRVIQKNLVYVVGLSPPAPSEELHTILRSDKYFGQYGKILKIVINKRNPPPNAPPIAHRNDNAFGVYVTFSKKEEATKCINAIDGTFVDGKPLKAAYGTTKYCSSYLRGQPCPNPNCMFLHEPGEEADSYTRQDLSTRQGLKMGGEQQPLPSSSFKSSAPAAGPSSVTGGSFSRHSNGSQYFNHHKEQEEQSQHHSGNHTPQPANAQIQPHQTAQAISGIAPLPATASWASNIPKTSNVSSPVISSSALANSSAFPTLAESTTLQQQQHHQQQARKQKNNNTNSTVSDEFNCEYSAISFIDETINLLNNFPKFNYQIKSDLVDEETLNSFPPLFAFANIKVNNNSNSFNVKLVESLISKPVNRSLSPPPSSVSQQSTLQQQQIQQLQQQQQQTAISQLQQPQAQVPQQLTPSQQAQQLNGFSQHTFNQQQQPYFTPQTTTAALLQHQQQLQEQDGHSQAQLLQEQLRQQQQQQQQLLLNQLKNERNYANTPPPPGLFQSNGASAPSNDSNSQVGGTASELLNHLMNGKKIST